MFNKPAKSDAITLYHGSKAGLDGCITPSSREHCDFGRGFYMGTEPTQPLTLICDYPHPVLYTLNMDFDSLDVLELRQTIDWALLIAFHRGKMMEFKETSLYQRYAKMLDGVDVAIGLIANDRMFVVLDRFFNGAITDVSLVACLQALHLGRQYVALTQRACDRVSVVDKRELDVLELADLRRKSNTQRQEGIALANDICKQHRREGRFFDEILAAETGAERDES